MQADNKCKEVEHRQQKRVTWS